MRKDNQLILLNERSSENYKSNKNIRGEFDNQTKLTHFDGLHLFIKTFAVLQGPP